MLAALAEAGTAKEDNAGITALQDLVRQQAEGWADDLNGIEENLGGLRGFADDAQEALSTSEPDGLLDARDGATPILDQHIATSKKMQAERNDLAGTGADVSLLDRIYDQAFAPLVGRYANPEDFGNSWVIWKYTGDTRVFHMEGYRGGVDNPPATGDVERDAERWAKYLALQADRWHEILVEGQETRDYGESLPTADGLSYWDMCSYDEDSPVANEVGRSREYCEAVMTDTAGAEWGAFLQRNTTHTSRQISVEDIDGHVDWEEMDGLGREDVEWQGNEVDFGDLDEAVNDIIDEVDDSWSDDDVIMACLNEADTAAEREYILRRLRDKDGYFEMVSELDGEEVDEFDAYRSEAGNYAHDTTGGAERPSGLDALCTGMRLLPGAVISTAAGIGYSIPIAGDVLEAELGDTANQWVMGTHDFMGVDERSAALSHGIASSTGKVAGSIGTMAIGGHAWRGMKAGRSALTTAGAAAVYTGVDFGNNVGQALSGKKVTGQKLSGLEQVAAVIGSFGGAADFFAALKAARAADDLLKAGSGAAGTRIATLDDLASLIRAQRSGDVVANSDEVVDVSNLISRGLGFSGQLTKVADNFTKRSNMKDARTMPEEDLVEAIEQWIEAHPNARRAAKMRKALQDGDMATLRIFLGEVQSVQKTQLAIEGLLGISPSAATQ